MLALQISEKLIREELFSENDLLCASVHEENKKDRGKLGPCHLIFAAFDHRKTNAGDSGPVAEQHLAQSDEIIGKRLFVLLDFFFGWNHHICVVLHFSVS